MARKIFTPNLSVAWCGSRGGGHCGRVVGITINIVRVIIGGHGSRVRIQIIFIPRGVASVLIPNSIALFAGWIMSVARTMEVICRLGARCGTAGAVQVQREVHQVGPQREPVLHLQRGAPVLLGGFQQKISLAFANWFILFFVM